MTDKKKALIEAICDAYGFDYPETDQEYEAIWEDYNFTSGCYVNHKWLCLAEFLRIAEDTGLLVDDDY